MDAKDLRTESTLGSRSHDGSNKYSPSATAITCNRNKSYLDIGSNSLGKVEVSSSRPCAVIGPDRVVPPSATADPFPKKLPPEQWMFADPLYRRPPDYPVKMSNYQNQTRNISPRQTFQENMQRIMMPPTYNSIKMTKDPNLPGDGNLVPMPKNTKVNEAKYCDVPYNVSPLPTEQKNVRDVNVPSVSSINQSAPYGWNAASTVRPSRPFGAPELYQYPDYPGSAGSRTMPVGRPVRNFHEENSSVFPERFFPDGNIRYKPYPQVKEGYPQARYECINNYPNPYHPPPYPPPRYDIQKSHNPHLYSSYSQVPVKYFDNRMPDQVIDGYQRSNPQQNYNVSYPNQFMHPAYGPVSGNCLQNKLLAYPSDMQIKANTLNKLAYENKLLADYENVRNKQFVPENYYGPKSQIMISKTHASNTQNTVGHPYYRKDYTPFRNYDPTKYTEMAAVSNTSLRFPSQFSPNVFGMSPLEANDQMHGLLLEDSNYLNHPTISSMRCADQNLNRMHPDMYARHDHKFAPIRRPMSSRNDTNSSSNMTNKDKKNINVRQFLQQWNDDDDNNIVNNPKQEGVQNTSDAKLITEQEQLYILGSEYVPSEELSKYEHIQKISKLPDNIKGYNSLELLNQFEEAIQGSNMNPKTTMKPPDYQRHFKTMPIQRATVPPLQRPLSPLDVEAKISQSVIHKEVGCNFEIKPCSPKMLSVETAAPVQTMNEFNERVIEKLSNPHLTKSPINPPMVEPIGYKVNGQDQNIAVNTNNHSCKMNENQYDTHNYTVPAKSDYSLSDLEASSGVCLASLPRLDNEIELNFPEVNQQFINANTKTDTVITITKSENLTELTKNKETVLDNNYVEEYIPSQMSPNIDSSQKLCKFRKAKKDDSELNNEIINNAQAIRTDSVIMKNPDTVKGIGCSSDSSITFTNLVLQNNEKLQNDDDENIALDFSVNKYSFDYDVNNKLENDLYGNKNVDIPNICETAEEKPDLILDTAPIAESVTKDYLSPETVKSEMETKTQDPTFLVESNDLEPEHKDIDTHNIVDVHLPSDIDSDTGASDDSNTQFSEDNISLSENIQTEEVGGNFLEKASVVKDTEQNTLNLHGNDENKIELSKDISIYMESKEIPNLVKEECSEITNVQNENVIAEDDGDNNNISISFESPITHKNLKTPEESVDIVTNPSASDCCISINKNSGDSIIPKTEQSTSEIIESSDINKKEAKNVCKDHSTTSPTTDYTLGYCSALPTSSLFEEHIQRPVMTLDDIQPNNESECVVSNVIEPIYEAIPQKYENILAMDKMKNKIHQDNKKTNDLEDISLITGICFTKLSLEICKPKTESYEFNDYEKLSECEDSKLKLSECSTRNSLTEEYKESTFEPLNNRTPFVIKNDILDSKLNSSIDYSSQKLIEYFEEDTKEAERKDDNDFQDLIITTQTTPKPSICIRNFVFENDTTDTNTNSTESITKTENRETTKLSKIVRSYVKEMTSNVDNKIHESIATVSEPLNSIYPDRFEPSFKLHSDINCEIRAKEKLEPISNQRNRNSCKRFVLKFLSPQMYNLTMYESGACSSKAKSNLCSFNLKQTINVSSNISFFGIDTCKDSNGETLLSMPGNTQDYNSSNFPADNILPTDITSDDDSKQNVKLKSDNLISLTVTVDSKIYQVPSLKKIVSTFINVNFSNIDLNSVHENSNNLEKTFSSCNNTTQIESDTIDTNTLGTKLNKKIMPDPENVKRYLKRSLSESDLVSYDNTSSLHSVNNIKRQKIYTRNELDNEIIAENIFLQNNRRNSISTLLNEEDVSFCILIDDNCIIAEECEDFNRNSSVENSEACFELVESELNIVENCSAVNISCMSPVKDIKHTKYSNNILDSFSEHQSDEGTWVDDVACVETVVSEDIAEDIEVGSESSPLNESISDCNSEDEDSYNINNNFNDHAEKVKHIYEGCHDNDRLVETLFRTPQMNVNKTLVKENQDVDHSIDQERADLENMLSESPSNASKTTVSDVTILARDSLIEARNLAPHTFNEEMVKNYKENQKIDTDDYRKVNSNLIEDKSHNTFVYSSESSYDNDFSYSELTENTTQYSSSSSSPEVSSTTSEEKCSSILLKITSYNGSIVSEISNNREIKRISCKYTEKNDYNTTNSNRPLITKAAQKYIPPISETNHDLKVKLPLPQHSLLKLQKLKHCKGHLRPESNSTNRYFPLRPDLPKKPKPKFEDVLKSIDEIQFKMHKEKKKIKKYIPKVVIKKNGNGSHYTSASSHDSCDPDLTGMKWQPWVFIERNCFIDKMATTRKTEAIYSHRKKQYVYRDKFQKYKSVSSAKFVITQPKLDDKGQLKYTIKLKHNY